MNDRDLPADSPADPRLARWPVAIVPDPRRAGRWLVLARADEPADQPHGEAFSRVAWALLRGPAADEGEPLPPWAMPLGGAVEAGIVGREVAAALRAVAVPPELGAVAVVEDRYGGTYAGGCWLAVAGADLPHRDFAARAAWVLRGDGPHGGDGDAMEFWSEPLSWIAVGPDPAGALANLAAGVPARPFALFGDEGPEAALARLRDTRFGPAGSLRGPKRGAGGPS